MNPFRILLLLLFLLLPYSLGELRNLVGKVISVHAITKAVTIEPMNSTFKETTVVEASLLVKHIVAGAHVKVRIRGDQEEFADDTVVL